MVIGTPTVLNLIPGGVMKIIHVNQVNENIEIQFRIMNGAQPFNVPEGVSCTIRGTKGDNFGYAAAVAVTAGSNIVTVTLTEQLTAVAGAGNIFELVFVGASDDMKVSTENFLLDVERAALGEDTVISDSDLAYADQVLDQLQSVGAVNAQVQQNKANIAAEITRATTAEQTLQQNINAEAAARQAADNTLQSNINAEASSRATTDASLQSQIDQLIAPSGSAPSAAEVENARIGSDGTVYPTLGDAIRTQNSLLKSHLEDTEDAIQGTLVYSVYQKSQNTSGSINSSGVIGSASIFSVTGKMPVAGCSGIQYSGIASDYSAATYFYFYTANDAPVYGFIPGTGTNRISVPSNAAYVRFSVKNTDADNFQCYTFGSLTDLESDVENLKADVELIEDNAFSIEYGDNLFDKSTATVGTYYNSDGLIRSSASVGMSDKIPVVEGNTYCIFPSQFWVVFFDKNGFFVKTSTTGASSFVVPSGAEYCRFIYPVTSVDAAILAKGATVPAYSPYKKTVKLVGGKTYDILVAKDGSGDYTTVSDAVANCASGDTIFVRNGLYENEAIDASAKTVHVIGESREFTIIENDTNDYATPPLEASAGSFENLTFYEKEGSTQGSALAYACHIDYDYSNGKELVFRNCCFKNDNYQAVGIGLRGNFKLVFDNCEFFSQTRVAYYMHDSVASGAKTGQYVRLKDCIIHSAGSDHTIRIISYMTTGASIDFEMINCAIANETTQAVLYLGNIAGEGGAQTRVYSMADLANYHLTKCSYGNQLAEFNAS